MKGLKLLTLALVAGFATPALADVIIIPGTSYSSSAGAGNTGVDAFGNPWAWSHTLGSGAPTPGVGFSAWGTPGLGAGVAPYGSATPATEFAVTFVGFPIPVINETPSPTGAGYNEATRFSANGVLWTPEYIGTNTVEFVAPAGAYLTQGEDYFVNVVFAGKNLSGKNTGFTAAFAAPAPAPVPGAGLAGLAALALAGLYVRARRA